MGNKGFGHGPHRIGAQVGGLEGKSMWVGYTGSCFLISNKGHKNIGMTRNWKVLSLFIV